MDIKDITVVVDQRGERPALPVAIDLTKRFGGHLTGLSLVYDPVVPGYAVAPVPVDFMVSARNEAVRGAKAADAAFLAAVQANGVTAETRSVEIISAGGLDEVVHELRLADLVIVAEDDRDQPEPVREPLIEAILFHAGAPLLIIPRAAPPASLNLGRVIIAWDGTITAARAVRSALPFLAAADAVDIVIVDDGKDLPTGQRVTGYLARHGIAATTHTIPNPHKDVAAALRQQATETGAGLIVMGAYGHSRLLEWILGGATRGMLHKQSIPILMAH
ncbi:universal stress protein [Mesorhizobium sp. BR1-1-16]|uniref:universal stress protein n=1 Tax=Mesorhizobium sp. BR1-1-16 TaxID=2876653 RepID=UPI001CCD0342|nr:universal stress protein [Mesorhizobium sp. BR1-1-16]MBZ9934683.1 universal stress protein [Mesorhizobium sp. BR1-1-16]